MNESEHRVEEFSFVEKPKLRKYIAITSVGLRIISVSSTNIQDAISEIVSELEKPGREEFLRQWKRDGRMMCEEAIPPWSA
jgi:hypothetical protein